jgi:hypothetical protein
MSGETKFWIVYSTDINRHMPQMENTEIQAEALANRLARENPGIHFYVLESKSCHVGIVEVDKYELVDDPRAPVGASVYYTSG